jgi:hypothetical protein
MNQWISKLFLFTALAVVLMHNIVAHHHADEKGHGFRDNHHSLLELVRMDHVFYTECTFSNDLHAVIPDIVFCFDYAIVSFPIKIAQAVILPDEPYPPGWVTDQIILRGPPVNC